MKKKEDIVITMYGVRWVLLDLSGQTLCNVYKYLITMFYT